MRTLKSATTLKVSASVRYWEDAFVNGQEDLEGALVPCRDGNCWCPLIDIRTGKILNWESGKTADVHYKVCDEGSYHLLNAQGNVIAEIIEDYVPDILCPKEEGYGDYIIMDIDENGVVQDWKIDFSGFDVKTEEE